MTKKEAIQWWSKTSPFWLPEEPPETWESRMLELLERYGRTLANIMLVFLFFLFVVRPILTWFRQPFPNLKCRPMETPALPPGEGHDALAGFQKGIAQLEPRACSPTGPAGSGKNHQPAAELD